MRVLVTSDDGVGAPGLRALATAVHCYGHEPVVGLEAAPALGVIGARLGAFGDAHLQHLTVLCSGEACA